MHRLTTPFVCAFVLIALALVPLTGDKFFIYLGAEIIIFALFALSFNLLLGYGGMLSFGHAAYFAIGAYTCAIFLTTLELPFLVAFLGAVGFSAVGAAIIGYFCVKLTEVYFAMLTLAFGQLVWAIAFKWVGVTGGDTGFIGVAVPEMLKAPATFYYFALIIVTLCVGVIWIIVNSAFGYTLQATRENRNRAEFIGVNVRLVQHVTFVIAGTFAGVAGALFTLFNHSVFVESAWWSASAEVLIMTILGGVGSFFGPLVGAATLIILDRITTEFTVYWPTVLGIILLIVLFFFPEGLMGVFKKKKGGRS
ncbi:branched-chain amino acid ABC transporter permease [Hoeflea prorocentri]|uniref:Branched-chain amino acid ABC transporter permease n=1 Tax=Hoeflea prorocentri TaxID=1922333 RepID=A0A9X3UQW5_9HYPH|nr:branched-chain amino acid ABC transporter permease [Hoeflea prorocentri]MCY6383719.1 branched-chain amino acid ABC transporter permease [Hoeflea prorocentri]MDA5401519.1 branched-chain amino acid ABC transporter permease [Hoeflea prorocentri]